MKYIDYSKVLENGKNIDVVLSGVVYESMQKELKRIIDELIRITKRGKVRWIKWDKERFDKDLIKEVNKFWKVDLDVTDYWTDILEKLPMIYVQQDFMEDVYGYRYSCGKGYYKDYGNVVFYANHIDEYSYFAEEMLEYWFTDIVIPKYKKWYGKKNFFGMVKNKEFYQNWYPIYNALSYFNPSISKEDLKNYIRIIARTENVILKEITDYEIIF